MTETDGQEGEQEEDSPEEGEPEPEQEEEAPFDPINLEFGQRSTHVIPPPRGWKEKVRTRLMYLLIEETKFKFFIILIASLVVFGTTFTMKLHERIALAIMVAMIIYMLWIKVIIPEEKPAIKNGYVVTWKDRYGHMPMLRREHNLKLMYCQFAVYPDGSVESVPDTEFLGAYSDDMNNHVRFNPLIDMPMKKHLEMATQQNIPYADGTDRYQSPLQVKHRRVSRAIQSGTPMAVKKTTGWLHSEA